MHAKAVRMDGHAARSILDSLRSGVYWDLVPQRCMHEYMVVENHDGFIELPETGVRLRLKRILVACQICLSTIRWSEVDEG